MERRLDDRLWSALHATIRRFALQLRDWYERHVATGPGSWAMDLPAEPIHWRVVQYSSIRSDSALRKLWQRAPQQHYRAGIAFVRYGLHKSDSAEGVARSRVPGTGDQCLQHPELHVDRHVGYLANLRPDHGGWRQAANHDDGPFPFLRSIQMISNLNQSANKTLANLLAFALLISSVPAQQSTDYTFRVQTELVLVNVTVRDNKG